MGLLDRLRNILGIKSKSGVDYTKPAAFEHTWSVVDFAKKHGKMQLGTFPEHNNRESYQLCRFGNEQHCIYASVSSRMQGITPAEVSQCKDRIRVGQLYNGNYVLYDFRWKDWETVDLGL